IRNSKTLIINHRLGFLRLSYLNPFICLIVICSDDYNQWLKKIDSLNRKNTQTGMRRRVPLASERDLHYVHDSSFSVSNLHNEGWGRHGGTYNIIARKHI
ncbi:hypothetical protein M8C21_017019, partial [Ambrosia artemisiifolia]